MPIVAFAFGSFGDIITVVQLALAIRTALCNCGPSSECQALIKYLESFAYSLEALKPLLYSQNPSKLLDNSAENAITYAIATCEMLMRDSNSKISQDPTPTSGASSDSW